MTLASVTAADPVAGFCIARTLPLEGGLVDNRSDPGGVTDHGVSLRWALAEINANPDELALFDVDHDGDVDRADIVGMTSDQAADVYHECIWKPGWYHHLAPPVMVAWKTFDIAVNTGPKRSGIILQRALVRLGAEGLANDGVVGPATIAAALAQMAGAQDQGFTLLNQLRLVQMAFYRTLAQTKPSLAQFLDGWLRRAAA